MSNARYVATVAATDPLAAIFTPAQATLWELDVTKSNRIVYKPVCTGKLEDIAKLAEELNAANSKEAKAEPVVIEPGEVKVTVGNPTEKPGDAMTTVARSASEYRSMRPGWEPLWIHGELERALAAVDAGRMNLVAFKNTIRAVEIQMREDVPK
jgi:hypothetical protein